MPTQFFTDYATEAIENIEKGLKRLKKEKQKEYDRAAYEEQILLNKYAPSIFPHEMGVYAILVNNLVMYVGKSKNIRERALAHIYTIQETVTKIMIGEHTEKKYRVLADAILQGYNLEIVTVTNCEPERLDDLEMEYINELGAPLNTYRPKRHYVPDTLEEAIGLASTNWIDYQ